MLDEARPGRPRTIDDDEVAAVIERTLRLTPADATHWSIRSMAAAVGFSHTTIRRIWTAFGLQPHRVQTFKLSSDPLFVDKVRDIVGLYLSPPNRALVLSVDEKSQIQALDGAGSASYVKLFVARLRPRGLHRQEFALCGGINRLMYPLTRNIKFDQVHVRNLLERLAH